MQQYRKNLGKVSLTAEGAWDRNKEYEILSIVYDENTNHAFVSRKDIPKGVDLYNKKYWMPFNVSGYADNNIILLSQKTSESSIESYTLEEAIKTVASVGRRPGAILGFYNENADRLDIGGRWEIWQYNGTDTADWENVNNWNNIYYNYNKFMGWFKDENFLNKYAPFPEIGCYAFVGGEFNDAILYRCDEKHIWINTGKRALNYIKVIGDVNIENAPDYEDLTETQDRTIKFADKAYSKSSFSGLGRIYLRKNIVNGKNILTQDMMVKENTRYIIQYDYDLDGSTLSIPEGSVLDFQGGSFKNGTISGNFKINTIEKSLLCNVNGSILNKLDFYDTGNSSINSSILTACKGGINLMEDITLDGCYINSTITGNNHKITFGNTEILDAFIVKSDGVEISDLELVKSRAITEVYSTSVVKVINVSRFAMRNCKCYGGIVLRTEYDYYNSYGTETNFTIENCVFDIDWTAINNINSSQNLQSDIITIQGATNVNIVNNKIYFKNVNRVFKITEYKGTQSYDTFENISRTINVSNNSIIGLNETNNGKQIFDLFFGGSHVNINHNYIEVKGHYCVLQDKSKGSSEKYENLLTIADNIIKYENCILNIINENSLSLIFDNNYCYALGGIIASVDISPLAFGYCKNAIIKNNVFESASSVVWPALIFFRYWGAHNQTNRPTVKSFVFKNNYVNTSEAILMIMFNDADCNIDSLIIEDNYLANDIAVIEMRGSNTSIGKLIYKDYNMLTLRNKYPFQIGGIIGYMKMDVPYLLGQRVYSTSLGGSIGIFDFKHNITGGVNKTMAPSMGISWDRTYLSAVSSGTSFYDTQKGLLLFYSESKGGWINALGELVE